jgi:hypothetical protein
MSGMAVAIGGVVEVREVPNGREMDRGEFAAGVVALAYDAVENVIYVADGEGQVWASQFEC